MAAGGPGGHLDAPWVISKFRQNARTRHGACSLIIGMRRCWTSFAAMASMGIDVDLELSVCTFGAASQHPLATYEIAMRFSPQNVMRGGRDSSGMRAGNRGDRGDVRWSQDGP